MNPMKVILTFGEGAALHRVVQSLRTLVKDAGIPERPEIVIVAGDQGDALGIATQLRSIGVPVSIHESLEVEPAMPFERAPLPPESILHGSDSYPAYVEINGDNVQLGTLVAKAHQLSGMSVGTWNGLSTDQRDEYIEAAIEAIRMQDPTAPVHDITGEEFAAALKQQQADNAGPTQADIEQMKEQLKAQGAGGFKDTLYRSEEQEKGDAPNPEQNGSGSAEAGPDIAEGHHFETRPDGTQTLRADDPPAADASVSTTTDGSASE